MVYPVSRHLLFPLIRFFIKKTNGLENLPKGGPYLLACKHFASLDGIFMGVTIIPHINRKIHFVANVAPWGWFWRKIIAEQWHGCIPFYKENPRICLDIAMHYLQKGEVVGIFPEGIIQEKNLNKHRAKTGVARLAIWAKVPIVPVGITNDMVISDDLPLMYRRRQAIKNILLNPHSMEINIGQPFELREYYDQPVDRDGLIAATNKVMDRIEALTRISVKK